MRSARIASVPVADGIYPLKGGPEPGVDAPAGADRAADTEGSRCVLTYHIDVAITMCWAMWCAGVLDAHPRGFCQGDLLIAPAGS